MNVYEVQNYKLNLKQLTEGVFIEFTANNNFFGEW
jgi:hypothetical protein